MSTGEAAAVGLHESASDRLDVGTAISRFAGGGPSKRELGLALVAGFAAVVALAATTQARRVAHHGRSFAVACEIGIPGYGSVHGTGTSRLAGAGEARSSCRAHLPIGAAPAKALRYQVGPCTIKVGTDGRVVGSCRSASRG